MTSELTSSKYFELIVNRFLNLLVRDVIEREIEREKVQMKPPYILIPNIYLGLGFEFGPASCVRSPCLSR